MLVLEAALTATSWPQVKLFVRSETGEQPPLAASTYFRGFWFHTSLHFLFVWAAANQDDKPHQPPRQNRNGTHSEYGVVLSWTPILQRCCTPSLLSLIISSKSAQVLNENLISFHSVLTHLQKRPLGHTSGYQRVWYYLVRMMSSTSSKQTSRNASAKNLSWVTMPVHRTQPRWRWRMTRVRKQLSQFYSVFLWDPGTIPLGRPSDD